MMYGASELAGKRRPTHRPTETAGLRWQPEMCPMANAIVNTVRPKANATPSNPMPTLGNAAASTALPHPPRTSQNVPKNSAPSFLPSDMYASFTEVQGLHHGYSRQPTAASSPAGRSVGYSG